MITLHTPAEVRAWRSRVGSVGLVPTMGALHAGHMSLVERALAENDVCLTTIFVNPSQFGPGEDLATYPRDLEGDTQLLIAAGCQACFAPAATAVYPSGYQTWVSVDDLSLPLEGTARAGHFKGVATVVLKLINIASASRAYFGQKDAQQLAVVRRMAADLNVPVEIVACPTVREPDGLALSSRNVYLSAAERPAAGVLFAALMATREAWNAGERQVSELEAMLYARLATEPLASIEYARVVDPATFLAPLPTAESALAVVAVRIGATRLIDNLNLNKEEL